MKSFGARIPADRLGASALYTDFVTREDSPLGDALGGFRRADPAWKAAGATRRPLDARLAERLVESNRAWGVQARLCERLAGLGAGTVRTVVTGQQPGVAGGPLLTLYKIATARALAASIEERTGTACVPVYWMGSDDDDFAEIRELTVVSRDMSLVSASLATDAYAPGRRVGDIDAAAVRRALEAVAPFLPDAPVTARLIETAGAAHDLGDAAARSVVLLTGGEVAVVDGRDAVLRERARELILDFFDREDEFRAEVGAAGRRLTSAGYHAQLEAGSGSGVYRVDAGIRRRIPDERRAQVRSELLSDITRASPGVVLRNLMQDALFRPAAVVLGPAEIAYRAQITGVYRALGLERPIVFPRLAATFAPPAIADVVRATGVDAGLLATDAGRWREEATAALTDAGYANTARTTEDAVRREVARFVDASSGRLEDRARDKLEKRIADAVQRIAQALASAVEQDARGSAGKWPFLARSAELFVRDGVAQERFLGMMVPSVYAGDGAWRTMLDLGAEHVGAALDGRVEHRVYCV